MPGLIGRCGGGSLAVTDGTVTVSPTTLLNFVAGAVVTDAGSGEADVSITGGSGATLVFNGIENLTAHAVTIPNSGNVQIPWTHSSGASYLNLTNPDTPTFIATGLYSVTAVVQPGPLVGAPCYVLAQFVGGAVANLSDEDEGYVDGVVQDFCSLSITATVAVTAGYPFWVNVFQTAASDNPTDAVLRVQLLATP